MTLAALMEDTTMAQIAKNVGTTARHAQTRMFV